MHSTLTSHNSLSHDERARERKTETERESNERQLIFRERTTTWVILIVYKCMGDYEMKVMSPFARENTRLTAQQQQQQPTPSASSAQLKLTTKKMRCRCCLICLPYILYSLQYRDVSDLPPAAHSLLLPWCVWMLTLGFLKNDSFISIVNCKLQYTRFRNQDSFT